MAIDLLKCNQETSRRLPFSLCSSKMFDDTNGTHVAQQVTQIVTVSTWSGVRVCCAFFLHTVHI